MEMHIERERRFEVINDGWRDTAADPVQIGQGWLHAGDGVQVRVRAGDAWGSVACKIDLDSALERLELETSVDPDLAAALLARCAYRLRKTRWIVEYHGIDFEVDEYHDNLTGFVAAEVENPQNGFLLPRWIGREVTGVAGWSNADLARYGLPDR
jgi:adenylate cyclase